MKRFLAFALLLVLSFGLASATAFAQGGSQLGELGALIAVQDDSGAGYTVPTGLQLNDESFSVKNYSYSDPRFGILPSYLASSDIAIEFEGTVAPRLMLGKTYENSPEGRVTLFSAQAQIAWNKERTGGLEVFSNQAILEAWQAGAQGVEFDLGDVRKVYVQGSGQDVTTTIKRIVLTGVNPLPDVAYGAYGDTTVRRLYTRPVTLVTSPDSSEDGRRYRTVNIDISNPIYDGADIAVRYTGSRPFLSFCYVAPGNDWKGWTSVDIDAGALTATANDATGQKVTFYNREEIETYWREHGGKDGNAYDHMFVSVHAQNANYPEGSEECNIVEVVALGGTERINPLESSDYNEFTGQTAEEIAYNMHAGYNLAGHFESHWVPDKPAKDGGWSNSDLSLEAHWARGVYITRENVRAIKAAGFRAVRLPVTWYQHIYPIDDPTGDPATREDLELTERYHIDRAWMERVHEVVDWCIAEDLYVILNIHHEDWIDRQDLDTAYDETDLPVRFKAVWTQIANEFSGYDQHLVFEDMNEPHMWFYERNEDGTIKLDSEGKKETNWGFATAESVNTVNRLNADFVDLVRNELSGHDERLLMMSHDTGRGEIATTGWTLPCDPANMLALSMHYYTPHDWTHYFANGKHKDEDGSANVYTASYRNEVEAAWDRLRTRYSSQGIPVILGEFGCYYLTDERQQERLEWMTQFATHAKQLGVPMFYWRMDRTKTDAEGNEYVEWSAFDEKTHALSPLSSHMFERWFAILQDESIEWDSRAEIDPGEHADMATGVSAAVSGALPKRVVSTDSSEVENPKDNDEVNAKCRVHAKVYWSTIAGNEIAVKFAGNTPRLGMLDENWKGDWWGIEPDSVDHQNGIAYFRASSIATRWESVVASNPTSLEGAVVDDISRILLRTNDSGSHTPEDAKLETTVEAISIVHTHDWGPWTPTGETDNGEAVETRTCSKDASHIQTKVAHRWSDWQIVADETSDTGTSRKRSCLNHPDVVQTMPDTLAHDWESDFTIDAPATCTEPGCKSFHCARCEATKNVSAIPVLNHKWGAWTSAGESEHVRTCEHDPSHVESAAHVWDAGTIARAATTAAEGERTFTCADCGAKRTETIEKLPSPTPPDSTDSGGSTAATGASSAAASGTASSGTRSSASATTGKATSSTNRKAADGSSLGAGASERVSSKALASLKPNTSPAGTAFAPLKLRSTKQTKSSIKLLWTKVKGAKRYIVYGNACGKKNRLVKLATTTKKSLTVKKANGKKLKKGTYYKLAIIAIDKRGSVVSTSKIAHVATSGGKAGNPSKVAITKPKKGTLKLKRGKSFTLKSKDAKPAGKRVRYHRKLAFESSNAKVATVSKSGKVKARSRGTCYVYAYAQNGLFAKVKVKVR